MGVMDTIFPFKIDDIHNELQSPPSLTVTQSQKRQLEFEANRDWQTISNIWQQIELITEFNDIEKYADLHEELATVTHKYIERYSEFLGADSLSRLKKMGLYAQSSAKVNRGIFLVNSSQGRLNENMHNGIRFISENIENFIVALSDLKRREILKKINDTATWILEQYSSSKELENILVQSTLSLQQKINKLINEKEFIEFNLDGEIFHLSPDSAEGKALIRIRDSQGNTDDWNTVVEKGEDVDLEEISQWLEANGFA